MMASIESLIRSFCGDWLVEGDRRTQYEETLRHYFPDWNGGTTRADIQKLWDRFADHLGVNLDSATEGDFPEDFVEAASMMFLAGLAERSLEFVQREFGSEPMEQSIKKLVTGYANMSQSRRTGGKNSAKIKDTDQILLESAYANAKGSLKKTTAEFNRHRAADDKVSQKTVGRALKKYGIGDNGSVDSGQQ